MTNISNIKTYSHPPVLGADPPGHILPGLRLVHEHGGTSAQLRVQVRAEPLRLHWVAGRALRQNEELGTPRRVVSSEPGHVGMAGRNTLILERLSLWVTGLLVEPCTYYQSVFREKHDILVHLVI